MDRPADALWHRLTRGVQRVRARSDWARFAGAGWADRIMGAAVTDDFHSKQGRSTGRWVLQANGQRLAVYLKRHYRLPWWRGLLASLWPGAGWSPALQEWQHLQWARARGVPVPEAVAAGEYIGPWGRLQSFLAVEELRGMLPLHLAIPAARARLDPDVFQRWKHRLVAALARLTRTLHDQRRFHKDLYLCHFYVPWDEGADVPGWDGQVHLIDLHRFAHHPLTCWLWRAKDLAQLLYSSDVAGVTLRDRLQFWREYLGPAGQRSCTARWLQWCILFKGRRYRRHNAKRRR